MSRNIHFAPGEFYHLYNRGTEKRKIFHSPTDYKRFLTLLYLCNGSRPIHLADLFPRGSTSWKIEGFSTFERGEQLVNIGAYCLMPNHFHLLVQENIEGGVSRFMQKLITAYTMYFNAKERRTGGLFSGKYKAQHATEDRYLKYLISYIHLNPVKLIEPKWKEVGIKNRAHAKSYLHNYPYSSFPDYYNKDARPEKCILTPSALPSYFTPANFETSVTEWLAYKDREGAPTRSNLVGMG